MAGEPTTDIDPRKIEMLRIIADNGGSMTLYGSNDVEMACITAAGNWMQEMGYGEPTELGPDSLLIELSPKGMEACRSA